MDNKQKAWNELTKVKFELDDKLIELGDAKNNYREELVNETINNILTVLNQEGKVTERDLKLFLNRLSIDVMNLYYR